MYLIDQVFDLCKKCLKSSSVEIIKMIHGKNKILLMIYMARLSFFPEVLLLVFLCELIKGSQSVPYFPFSLVSPYFSKNSSLFIWSVD